MPMPIRVKTKWVHFQQHKFAAMRTPLGTIVHVGKFCPPDQKWYRNRQNQNSGGPVHRLFHAWRRYRLQPGQRHTRQSVRLPQRSLSVRRRRNDRSGANSMGFYNVQNEMRRS
jgi:hypothetical protein